MGLVSIKRDRTSWRYGFDSQGKRSAALTYLVEMSSLTDGPQQAANAIGIRKGGAYQVGSDGDPALVCKKIDATCPGIGSKIWHVAVEWGERDPGQEPENPVKRNGVFSYGQQSKTKVFFKDRYGKACVNAANDPFDPPVQDEVYLPTFTFTRNEPTWDPKLNDEYANAVNSDRFLGRDKETVLCQGITANGPSWENGVEFWVVAYSFAVDPEGWLTSVLNQGRNQIVGGKKSFIKVKTANGVVSEENVPDPVPLTAKPKKENGDVTALENPTPDTVNFIDFRFKKKKSFSRLNIRVQ